MALNPAGLEVALRDDVFPTASIVPATVAQLWGNALAPYVAGIVPASTTTAAATASLVTTLTGIFSTGGTPASKAASMEAAFLAWATAIGLGMTGFTTLPPAGLIGFAAEFNKPSNQWSANHAIAATLWRGKIQAWMLTGSATLIAPPNTIVPWS